MTLEVHRPRTVDEFLAMAGTFLAEREPEHNLLLGLCSQIRSTPDASGEAPRFIVVKEGDRVAGASLRIPPNNEVLSEMEPETVDALVGALAGEALPGVVGPVEAAGRFARAWSGAHGVRPRLDVRERIFQLTRVIPARPTTGRWRLAEPRDRPVAAEWILAFIEEAIPGEPPPPDPLVTADRWIAGTYRQLYVWEDKGRPVSMVGAGGETPHGIRIGPVYTPPEQRNRGYASALTAAVSQDQLDRGRQFCFLFTDLANPTSNHIYQAIGYRPIRDVDMYRFESRS